MSPKKRKPDLVESSQTKRPKRQKRVLVRPRFWKQYTKIGEGKRRDPQAKETVEELQGAFDGMVHLEGDLTFNQQREAFPYIFWPPLSQWCLVPFDISTKTLRTETGAFNPLRYGLGQKHGDQMWKHAVLAVFQPWRQYCQIFDHLLIPVHLPWQDDSTPDQEVLMFALVHVAKGSKTAYCHVMTEWQQDIYDTPAYNKLWADGIVQQLTSEQGIDDGLFLGSDASIEIKFVPNRVGEDWKNLGWNGRDMAELSKLTFYYIVYAATQLAVHGVGDTDIPEFNLDTVLMGLAQALLGVSSALDDADEGRKSVRDGIKPGVSEDASSSLRKYRSCLDSVIPLVTRQYDAAFSGVKLQSTSH